MYVAVPANTKATQAVVAGGQAISAFTDNKWPESVTEGKRLMLSTVQNLGAIGTAPVSRFLELGYDELQSVQYFGANLKPWWRNTPGASLVFVFVFAVVLFFFFFVFCVVFVF